MYNSLTDNAILRHTAVTAVAYRKSVLTHKEVTGIAIVAMSANNVAGFGNNSVADFDAFYIFADFRNNAAEFVTERYGRIRPCCAVFYFNVGSADSDCFNLYFDIGFSAFRLGNIAHFDKARALFKFSYGFHTVHLFLI